MPESRESTPPWGWVKHPICVRLEHPPAPLVADSASHPPLTFFLGGASSKSCTQSWSTEHNCSHRITSLTQGNEIPSLVFVQDFLYTHNVTVYKVSVLISYRHWSKTNQAFRTCLIQCQGFLSNLGTYSDGLNQLSKVNLSPRVGFLLGSEPAGCLPTHQ